MRDRLPGTDDSVDGVLEKYSEMVYRIAFSRTKNRADADDILQDVFLRYMTARTDFINEAHRKAWLIRAAVNSSKNLLNSAWFRRTTELDDSIMTELKEQSEVYMKVMQLPQKYRIVIHLHYYEDMSVSVISQTLRIKESTIKSQLHRARKILKEKLKGDFDNV